MKKKIPLDEFLMEYGISNNFHLHIKTHYMHHIGTPAE